MQWTIRTLAAVSLWALPAMAAVIYENPAVGIPDTAMYSAGPYVAIGDEIALSGTEREATLASAQFFNAGLAGTFDAVLQFYLPGAPVGAALGAQFVVKDVVAPELADITVDFALFGLTLPNSAVVYLLEARNATAGVDVGVNLYGGAIPGTFLVNTGSFGTVDGVNASDPFFRLEARQGGAAAVPEPGTAGLMGLGLAAAGWLGRRRRKKPVAYAPGPGEE